MKHGCGKRHGAGGGIIADRRVDGKERGVVKGNTPCGGTRL